MAKKKKNENVEDIDYSEGTEEYVESVEPVSTPKSKRDIIIDTIEAGGATMESLTTAANCKYASVMSNFSMLRLMGKCPVKDVEMADEDGNIVMTYRLVTPEEWEQIKAEKASKAKVTKSAKTPEEQLAILEARIERLAKANSGAQVRADNNPSSRVLKLRADKAAIELEIANVELEELNAKG